MADILKDVGTFHLDSEEESESLWVTRTHTHTYVDMHMCTVYMYSDTNTYIYSHMYSQYLLVCGEMEHELASCKTSHWIRVLNQSDSSVVLNTPMSKLLHVRIYLMYDNVYNVA